MLLERALEIAPKMMSAISIADRTWRMRRFEKCFVGRHAVEWMVRSGHAKDVNDAVAIGNGLLQAHIIFHVTRSHAFKNEDLLYRFSAHSLPEIEPLRASCCLAPTTGEVQLVQAMRKAVNVRDRSCGFFGLRVHRQCFLGSDAVQWLLEERLVKTEAEALNLGNRLMQVGLIEHVTGNQPFKNQNQIFYRFVDTPAVVAAAQAAASMSSSSSPPPAEAAAAVPYSSSSFSPLAAPSRSSSVS